MYFTSECFTKPHPGKDAHSLCLDLTVKSQSRPGQPWCEVQGSVDTKPFIQYDSDSNEVRPLGLLGEKVNATKAWTDLTQTLGEVGQELRMILPVIKLEKNGTRGSRRSGRTTRTWQSISRGSQQEIAITGLGNAYNTGRKCWSQQLTEQGVEDEYLERLMIPFEAILRSFCSQQAYTSSLRLRQKGIFMLLQGHLKVASVMWVLLSTPFWTLKQW
ncbi:hypothetical protein HPG69_010876, partial [Diceros bicornis minor]